MPSLTQLTEGSESLSALSELVDVPSIFTAGVLPSSSLFPGAGLYPKDNVTTPHIVGLALSSLSEGSETLSPLLEA